MNTYKYQLKDPGGKVDSGVIEAPSVADASGILRAQGGYLMSIEPIEGAAATLEKLRTFKVEFGPGIKDVYGFTKQLAVMIKAGINIRTAVASIAEQAPNQKFKKILRQVKLDVESGEPFSAALAKHPKVFSPLYVNMVKASELSGNFGEMLERVCDYLAQQLETRSMIRGAMIYPCIIAFMAVVATIFLLTFVLPRFTVMFEGKEDLLPTPTVMVISLSDFLRHQWYIPIAGTIAGIGAFWYAIHTPRGKRIWDTLKLKLPVFKKMFRALYISRGLHTMGELVHAGVPMLETLSITADVSGNALYRDLWRRVHRSVQQGQKIASPLEQQTLLPRNVVQMVSAGEESGRLGEVLRDVSEYYSKELKSTIKAVTAMIEPAMIVLMGVVVGFIAMSMILPFFKMSSLVK